MAQRNLFFPGSLSITLRPSGWIHFSDANGEICTISPIHHTFDIDFDNVSKCLYSVHLGGHVTKFSLESQNIVWSSRIGTDSICLLNRCSLSGNLLLVGDMYSSDLHILSTDTGEIIQKLSHPSLQSCCTSMVMGRGIIAQAGGCGGDLTILQLSSDLNIERCVSFNTGGIPRTLAIDEPNEALKLIYPSGASELYFYRMDTVEENDTDDMDCLVRQLMGTTVS